MENLMEAFSPVSLQQWKEKLKLDLKGKTFEDLSSLDRNGMTLAPFYNKENGRQGGTLFQNGDWAIVSRVLVGDNVAESNKNALAALQQGASGIVFEIGAAADTDPSTLLKAIDYPYIFLTIDHRQDSMSEAWRNFFKSGDNNASSQQPFFFYDPIGNQLSGTSTAFEGAGYAQLLGDLSPYSGIAVDGRRYHNAGANSVTQLAAVLAHCNEYLNALKNADQLDIAANMQVRMATGTQFFEEIAKLRAFRKLLPLLGEAYGLNLKVHLHMAAGMLHRTPLDTYTNLLRDTIAGMAAVLGGCDSLEIPAFDANATSPSGRGDRLSRNQQLIFKEESYLNSVADAAAGSFYLDQRSEALAEAAWKMFQHIEGSGGFIENIRSGWLTTEIGKQADSLVEAYQSGENVLVGINKFPNPNDPPRALEKSVKEGILPELHLFEHLNLK